MISVETYKKLWVSIIKLEYGLLSCNFKEYDYCEWELFLRLHLTYSQVL